MIYKFTLGFCLLFLLHGVFAQNTVGTTIYEPAAQEGYTFFSPFSSTKAFMVDNCGNLINEWDRGTRPGLSAYFLDNGLMLRTYKADLVGPFTSASNAGGLELVDWDNNTVWSYEINTADQLSHHDAVMMPNGNILVLTWKLVYDIDLVAWGRDPGEIAPENFMWSERIVELKPIGTDDAELVWEWNIYDHYVQDFDETKANFGVISEHPELFDINLPQLNSSNSNSTRDWNHFNAIDYNPELDQILISVRNSDEIWIIDHSTTTAEAATHVGGVYENGGDILYRWGNASAYKAASVSEQQLFGQHGVHWVDEGEGLKNEGKILLYNNGNQRPGPDFSQIDVLDPPQTEPGFYIQNAGIPNAPSSAETLYGEKDGEDFYSPYLSNAQQLTNGNVLINAGSPGTIFEIDEHSEKVWEYVIPLFGDFPATQGDNIANNSNFRAYKFTPAYAGFQNIDLTPSNPIENNPSECEILVSTVSAEIPDFQVFYNEQAHELRIEGLQNDAKISLFSASGQLVLQKNVMRTIPLIILPMELARGVYAVAITDSSQSQSILIYID